MRGEREKEGSFDERVEVMGGLIDVTRERLMVHYSSKWRERAKAYEIAGFNMVAR